MCQNVLLPLLLFILINAYEVFWSYMDELTYNNLKKKIPNKLFHTHLHILIFTT